MGGGGGRRSLIVLHSGLSDVEGAFKVCDRVGERGSYFFFVAVRGFRLRASLSRLDPVCSTCVNIRIGVVSGAPTLNLVKSRIALKQGLRA